jgi:hypothetical protein
MFGISLTRLIIAGSIALALLGAAAAYVKSVERAAYIRGQDELQVAVEKRNKVAAQGAQEARNALDRCYDTGGTWDQTTGGCLAKK